MASLSVEEENYVRMSLLLTGISPRAAKNFFDTEFAPACLDATIKKEYNKLLDLKKKHRINQLQWNLLFPRFPGLSDSKTFDVTLMTALLRNLTPMTPPLCGLDRLPSAMETTQAADLARIKYYRNHLAHLEEGKIDTSFYNTAWADVTGAVNRLGGQQMKQECDHLKTKPLDQTNQEIMMDIKRSNDEIMGLKKSFKSLKRSHTDMKKSNKLLQENHKKVQISHEMLQVNYTKVKKSHKMLQEDHKKVTKEMEIIKTSQQDTVPWNIRARNEEMLKNWKDNDDTMFIKTRAAEHVLKCIKENSCVTITASSGVGKTATLRHVALQMVNEEYDVLMLTEPGDIVNYNNPNKKILFVFDDLFGNFSVHQSDIKNWDRVMKNIKEILEKKQTKILVACRLQVYLNEKFESLSIFKSCVCNLLSETICLSKTEKQSIAELYLKTKASEITDYCNFYDCYPLLCKLYHDSPKRNIIDFFQNPFSVYEAEIINLKKKGHPTKYCALALCVMFNNKLKKEIFTQEVNKETKTIIENTCEACRLDRGTSRLVLQESLESLKDTFIKQEQNMYKILHDKIFDFLAYFFGQEIILCLLKNADSRLIKERLLLERNDMGQFITIIPPQYHHKYIERMIYDWSKGEVRDVFSNINMKRPQFRKRFLFHLETLDISYQRQLAHICDKHKLDKLFSFTVYSFDHDWDYDSFDTALFQCSYIGDIPLVLWCCKQDVDIYMCTHRGLSPIAIACKYGHTEMVKMWLDKRVDYTKFELSDKSPLMMACRYNQKEIVNMLLDRGADCYKCDEYGWSSLTTVCSIDGYTEIVKMMLDKGVDFNKWDSRGQSSVIEACKHGRTKIVKMLLDKGTDCNQCDRLGQTPVMMACKEGHKVIVEMLLDRQADCNECDKNGQSSLMIACQYGHTEIVKILLDRGADCNICDKYSQPPIMKACENGRTERVKMLLDRGADCNICDWNGQSSVIKACANGYSEIVKMLLDRGADYNKCDMWGQSSIMMACEYGYTNIVKMLLESGANFNDSNMYGQLYDGTLQMGGHKDKIRTISYRKADRSKNEKDGQTPVMIACKKGHTEIVKMLLDEGADYKKCDWLGKSPLMKACEHGRTEIVKMLLNRGADYNECDKNSNSPVMMACTNGCTDSVQDWDMYDWRVSSEKKAHNYGDIVKLLLDRGADYDKCNKDGQSPIMMACRQGQTEIVKMLLDKGADCNTCDWYGQSSVMEAYANDYTKLIKMLLDREVDCNACDKNGNSFLMIACKNGHTEIVEMLLDRGADWDTCDKDGQSPLMKACEQGHKKIVKMLLERGVD